MLWPMSRTMCLGCSSCCVVVSCWHSAGFVAASVVDVAVAALVVVVVGVVVVFLVGYLLGTRIVAQCCCRSGRVVG